jgi:hypothetical protein
MRNWMRMIKQRLTYANVMASLALFIALGGTSYAVTQLPRNSVGSAQIKPFAVSSSEIRRNAVTSRAVRDGSISSRDLSSATRGALRGDQGPQGVQGPKGDPGTTYRAVVNSGGGVVRGNAVTVDHAGGSGRYAVAFERDVSACVATATLSDAQNGPTLETPPAGRITLGVEGQRLSVRTFAADGAAQDLPFSVIVAC